MIRRSIRMMLAATAAIVSPCVAQPLNDACTAAEPIEGFVSINWDNTAATTDGLSNPSCNFFSQPQTFNDVWYCWRALVSGTVQVSTCNQTSVDTKLAVFAGCGCPEGSQLLACADDSAGCNAQTVVRFTAVAGEQYLIRLGNFAPSGTGSGSLSIAAYVPTPLAGPITNPSNNHQYYLLPASSWTSAELDAVSLGGHLVTINDAEENEWVRVNVLGFDGADRRGWLGLNDSAVEGVFVWSSGQMTSYTNWNGGEPNNAGGGEDYAEMFGSPGGLWNDQPDQPTVQVYGIVEIDPTPTCRADFNSSGTVTVQDIFDFLGAYFTSSPAADINSSGSVTVQDIFDYLSLYFVGC